MDPHRTRPGPRRRAGAPSGPDEVRRAVLDAAAELFSERGVAEVSLREIARHADVQLALISRYIGTRDDLVSATLEDLGQRLAEDVLAHPLEGHGFEDDSVMVRWTRIAAHLALTGQLPDPPSFNPVSAIADTIVDAYGLDEEAARIRAAQVVASALGWRIFERYLLSAGGLDRRDAAVLHDDLTRMHRRLGATPWPSPPDPPSGRRK